MDEYIKGYQDGGYDTLKNLPTHLKNINCTDLETALKFIQRTVEIMQENSTRKLGCRE